MLGRAPNILWIVTTQWRAQACGGMRDPSLLKTLAAQAKPDAAQSGDAPEASAAQADDTPKQED